MSATCVLCERPIADTAYACTACGDAARRACHVIADHARPARDVAAGQTRRGPAVAGASGNGLPINLSAGARVDAVTARITTWARAASGDRGQPIDGTLGPTCRHPCAHRTCRELLVERHPDPLVKAARWLAGQTGWIRYQRYADEVFGDLDVCARVLRSIADGPGDRRWLGPCDMGGCETDLTAPIAASYATCRTCGTRHDVAERRDWLDQLARGHSYTATEIEQAYGIPAGRIRVWAHRGRILATGQTVEGWPTYPLGTVLDLAAQDAARRATEQAKRARRRDADEQRDRELAS